MNALTSAQRFKRIMDFENLTFGGYESLLERISELEAEVQATASAKLEAMLTMAEKIESLETELEKYQQHIPKVWQEINRGTEENNQLRVELAHWKNNHDTEVRRARILKERTDMPIERVQAYEQWGKDQAELAAAKERERTNDILLEQQGDKLAALNDELAACREDAEWVKSYLDDCQRIVELYEQLYSPFCKLISMPDQLELKRLNYELKYLPIYADQPDPTYIVDWVWEVRDQHGCSVAPAEKHMYSVIKSAIDKARSNHATD